MMWTLDQLKCEEREYLFKYREEVSYRIGRLALSPLEFASTMQNTIVNKVDPGKYKLRITRDDRKAPDLSLTYISRHLLNTLLPLNSNIKPRELALICMQALPSKAHESVSASITGIKLFGRNHTKFPGVSLDMPSYKADMDNLSEVINRLAGKPIWNTHISPHLSVAQADKDSLDLSLFDEAQFNGRQVNLSPVMVISTRPDSAA